MASVRIAATKDIVQGSIREFQVDGKPIAIANVAGNFHAVNGVCLHRGGPIGQGTLQGTVVTCPWHGWQFDVLTGKSLQNPSAGLPSFPVEVRGDEIFVEIS